MDIRRLEGYVDKFNKDFKFEDQVIYKNKKSLEVWLNPSLNNVKNIIKNAQDEVDLNARNLIKDKEENNNKAEVKVEEKKEIYTKVNGTVNKNEVNVKEDDQKAKVENKSEDSNTSSANSSPVKPKPVIAKTKPVPKSNFA